MLIQMQETSTGANVSSCVGEAWARPSIVVANMDMEVSAIHHGNSNMVLEPGIHGPGSSTLDLRGGEVQFLHG